MPSGKWSFLVCPVAWLVVWRWLFQATVTSSSTSAPWWELTSRWRVSSPTCRRGASGCRPTAWRRPSLAPSAPSSSALSLTWASSPCSARSCCGSPAPAAASSTPPPAGARSSEGGASHKAASLHSKGGPDQRCSRSTDWRFPVFVSGQKPMTRLRVEGRCCRVCRNSVSPHPL